MPNYDYSCLKCGDQFEVFQKMTDKQITNCPVCNGEVKRLIGTGLSPIFKGGGFYQTDYKTNNSKSETDSSPKKSENKSE